MSRSNPSLVVGSYHRSIGAFDLNLPASWQARLNQVGGREFRGVFVMGMVGVLIAASPARSA